MSISELLGLNSPRGLLAGGFGNEGGEFPTSPMLTSTPNGGFQVKIVHFPATRALVAILIFTSLKFLRVVRFYSLNMTTNHLTMRLLPRRRPQSGIRWRPTMPINTNLSGNLKIRRK